MRRAPLLFVLVVTACAQDPRITAIDPVIAAGGRAFVLRVEGTGFGEAPTLLLDGAPVRAEPRDGGLEAQLPALERGRYAIVVRAGARKSEPQSLIVENTAPTLVAPGPHLVRAGAPLRIPLRAKDFDRDRIVLTATVAAGDSKAQAIAAIEGRHLVVEAPPGQHLVRVTAHDGSEGTTAEIRIEAKKTLPPPKIRGPIAAVQGNRAVVVTVHGEDLTTGIEARYAGAVIPLNVVTRQRATVALPPRPRGRYVLNVGATSIDVDVTNSRPVVEDVAVEVDESKLLRVAVEASDPDGDALVRYAVDLPPGARFEAARNEVVFTPDFIQGGETYDAQIAATDGASTSTATLRIRVRDTIRPPVPRVVSRTSNDDHDRIVLAQRTDGFLDRRDRAGRSIEARLVVPHDTAGGRPLRVYLHGFGGGPYRGGRGDLFALYPHDLENTYWWGYQDERGVLTPYTVRRVLHLVAFVLEQYEGIDPRRVYLFGPSMGGAGAIAIGAAFARHFAFAEGTMGQMIPRLHRPTRLTQLGELWGPPSVRWDEADVPRMLVESEEAQNQFFYTRHGKDDPIIHFGAVLFASPVVHLGYYEALQKMRVGHYAVWDEGAHGPPDPALGPDWYRDDWDPATDDTTRLSSDRAFIAFTASALDDDPGTAEGDGTRAFDKDRGFGGELEVIGDQGWGGDRYGALNRGLRWDSAALVDEIDRFTVRLRAPERTSAMVTPRRVQRFFVRPHETIRWRFGDAHGVVVADERGVVAIRLELTTAWTTLALTRSPLDDETNDHRR